MAIRSAKTGRPPPASLVARILRAMRAKAEAPGEPQVYLAEGDPKMPGKQLYVVWDGWGDLEWERRGDAAFEAYGRFAPRDVHNLVLVMGLTPGEARNMGLRPVRHRKS